MKETLDVIRAVSRRLEIRCNKTRLCIASVGCSVPKPKIAKKYQNRARPKRQALYQLSRARPKGSAGQPSIPSSKWDVNITRRRIV